MLSLVIKMLRIIAEMDRAKFERQSMETPWQREDARRKILYFDVNAKTGGSGGRKQWLERHKVMSATENNVAGDTSGNPDVATREKLSPDSVRMPENPGQIENRACGSFDSSRNSAINVEELRKAAARADGDVGKSETNIPDDSKTDREVLQLRRK
ncbi:hypothetical protein KM043_013124 [Ampulex compressa]|nr:hypothetical protein KM043_013124 [Ampulex compressa]